MKRFIAFIIALFLTIPGFAEAASTNVQSFTAPLRISLGGTALSTTPTNGQLLIGNGIGYTLSTLTGTTNQLIVTDGPGSIILSIPQDIHTGASPTFVTTKLTGLTDCYIPYHSSDSVGLVNSPIRTDGSVVSIGVNPSSYYSLFVSKAPTDPLNEEATLYAYSTPTFATSSSNSFYVSYLRSRIVINTGVNNTGSIRGQFIDLRRNTVGASTDDYGSLSNLQGIYVSYGHGSSNTSATPQTASAYGIYISPSYGTGSISNMYDVYLAADVTGGTVTNRWGIYQANTANNYFAGKVGIGITPTVALQIGSATEYGASMKLGSNSPYIALYHAADLDALLLAASSGVNKFVTGSAAGDAILRYRYGKLHFANSITTIAMTLDASGNLGIGVQPSYPLHIYKSQNNITSVAVQNDNSGTGAIAGLAAFNDALSTGYMRMLAMGSSYTTSGGFLTNSGVLEAGSGLSGGISIIARASAGGIRLYTGGYADANKRMEINASGSIGFLGTTPSSNYKMLTEYSPVDPPNGEAVFVFGGYPTFATTGSKQFRVGLFSLKPIINTGVTNSYALESLFVASLRNWIAAGSDDSGTLADLRGMAIRYGHENTNASADPQTTAAYGIYVTPYYKTGDIGTAYDLYLGTAVTGGVVTTRYSIYQADSAAMNFFAGNVGIGGAVFGTSAAKVLSFYNGTAPTTAPSNVVQLWSEDINAAADKAGLHMMAESGTGKLIIMGILIKTDTGDPSQVHEGLGCINTYDNNFKVYADGGWRQLATW